MTAVAIDGPAGAGKSTVARAAAGALGFRYVDTGAMYRAVALAALEAGIAPDDEGAVAEVASSLDIVAVDGSVTLDGRDVTARIRAGDVTAVVSKVAAHPGVRDALVPQQRRLAERWDVVMEGRDIGSTVLPGADLKVYLSASLDERALRRGRELNVADPVELARVRDTIEARDRLDSNRSASPLVRAEGAVVLDTTGMTVEEVVERIVDLMPDGTGG